MKKTLQSVVFTNIIAITSVVALTLPALAQEAAPAAPAAAEMAVYKPSGAWMVGPAGLGDMDGEAPKNLPCVAINKFGNGFTLRLFPSKGIYTAP